MKTIYLICNLEVDLAVKDQSLRTLTNKGFKESNKITKYLSDKLVSKVYSSTYNSALETIEDFAINYNLEVTKEVRFNEMDFLLDENTKYIEFVKKCLNEKNYKNKESFLEMQQRSISAINDLLNEEVEVTAISTHILLISSILDYYDYFDFEVFDKIRRTSPLILKLSFKDKEFKKIKVLNI